MLVSIGLEVLETIMVEDGIKVGMLGEVDGVMFVVMLDPDAEQPVELA